MTRDVVNARDEVVGAASDETIAKQSLICRVAFVMLVNSLGQLLLHQRSSSKKSYPLYWSGAAAGHVKLGESYEEAAAREMQEELGVVTKLEFVGKFYSAEDHEMVGVFLGKYDGPVTINESEVEQVRFFSVDRLKSELPAMKATSFVSRSLPFVLSHLDSLSR